MVGTITGVIATISLHGDVPITVTFFWLSAHRNWPIYYIHLLKGLEDNRIAYEMSNESKYVCDRC